MLSNITSSQIYSSQKSGWYNIPPNISDDPTFKALLTRVEEIEKRLAILHPNEELLKKFDALKDAFENFIIIRKLTSDVK